MSRNIVISSYVYTMYRTMECLITDIRIYTYMFVFDFGFCSLRFVHKYVRYGQWSSRSGQ